MISVGWMPRPRLKWRTLAYTRKRRRRSKHQAKLRPRCNHDIVIFDHGPYELPIATVRPRAAGTHVRVWLGDLVRWLSARWEWLRPRTVPVIAAAVGMIFVLISADYLAHGRGACPRAPDRTMTMHFAELPQGVTIYRTR